MNLSPQTVAPLIAVAVAVPLILLRNRRPRTLRPQWMWVMPVLIVAIMAFAIWGTSMSPGMPHAAFGPADWAVLAAGAVLGGLAGFWRGRMTTIEKHADGTLKAQASPLGLILIVGLMLGRRALSGWLEPHADQLGLNVLAVADAFLVFVAAMIIVQRVEMFIRAKRIQAGETDDHTDVTAD